MSLGLSILDREDLVRMADLSKRIRPKDRVSHEAVKSVLLTYVRYSDANGHHARPTIPTVMFTTGASERTIRRALEVLERRPKLLHEEVEQRPLNGAHAGVPYAVDFERIAGLVDDKSLAAYGRMARSAASFVDRIRTPGRVPVETPGILPGVTPGTTPGTTPGKVPPKEVQEVQTVQPLGRKRDSNPWSNQFRADAEPLFTELVEGVVEDREP